MDITIWKRFDDEERRFVHNHIEDGRVPFVQRHPIGKFPHQTKAWAGGLWIRLYGQLADGKVAVQS